MERVLAWFYLLTVTVGLSWLAGFKAASSLPIRLHVFRPGRLLYAFLLTILVAVPSLHPGFQQLVHPSVTALTAIVSWVFAALVAAGAMSVRGN